MIFLPSQGDRNHPNASIYVRGIRDKSRSPLIAGDHARFAVLLLRLTYIVRLLSSPTAPPPLSPWQFVLLLDYGWTARVRVLFYCLAPAPVAPHPAISGPVFSSRERERCFVASVAAQAQAGCLQNSSHAIVTCQLCSSFLVRVSLFLDLRQFGTFGPAPKLFGYPDVHSRLQVTGTEEDFVLQVFHIWILGLVYTRLSWPIAPSPIAPGILL